MYGQIDGFTMGSNLAPKLANIVMEYHEKGLIRDYNYRYFIRNTLFIIIYYFIHVILILMIIMNTLL